MILNLKGIGSNKMINQRIKILKNVIIFSEANTTILKRIALSLIEITVEEGELIFNKGDKLDSMFIIVSGNVMVHDKEHIFARFSDNDFFGEYALIDSSVRSASVTAVEKTTLLRLDQSIFNEILAEETDVAKSILKALINRLRNYNILEEELTKNSIQIQKQRDELEKQRQELEELNATKDKFFTIIAHDLKNPFNTVIGLSELLMERYDTYEVEKIKEFINQIFIFSNNAYNLLENLLQWAKSQTDKLKVIPEKVDLFEITNENINLYKTKAHNKGIELISEIGSGLYAYIDKNMISTVIRNLVSNSIKYTRKGGKIVLTAHHHNKLIKFSVKDTGVGIPEENIDKLFRIDINISTQGTEDETGTGLGLIICKEFVEKNGGKIHASSNINNGTNIYFTVPALIE
ncbi:MAG: hypothetical protein A2041_04260 [Bacteroidetes bacterium GWA2_31_9b]|nr:MAG: hypothetical protein A2041_04260 [Bacteroidetes bacterium GWA2_31_9b]